MKKAVIIKVILKIIAIVILISFFNIKNVR